MPIFAVDDYMYKDLVDLTAIQAEETVNKSSVISAGDAPYRSSYGEGGRIKSALHPFNGGWLHLIAKVLGVLPASADDGIVNIRLYTNEWDSTASAMKETCDKTVATFGPIKAKDIIRDDGVAFDCILPENLGTKIQLGVFGTAFDAVSNENPMLEVMIEEYSTVHG